MKNKQQKPPKTLRNITFVVAPRVPSSELDVLKLHWEEAAADPRQCLVTNYEVRIDVVEVDTATEKLTVLAPDVPGDEVTSLNKKVRKALRKKDSVIFVNYDVVPFTMPKTAPTAVLF